MSRQVKQGFNTKQLKEIEEMLLQALESFTVQHNGQLHLLKSFLTNAKVKDTLKKLKIPSPTKSPKTSKTNESPTQVSVKVIETSGKQPSSNKLSPTTQNLTRKTAETKTFVAKPIKNKSPTVSKNQVKGKGKLSNVHNKEYASVKNVDLGNLDLGGDDKPYEKINTSNEPSLDTLLPNPFSDPLDDGYFPQDNSVKSKIPSITGSAKKKSKIPIPSLK